MTNEVPRRARIDLAIPAETAIRAAIAEVEKLGCHEELTRAVILLGDAQRKVADWYDGGAIGATQNVSLIDAVARDPNVSPALKAAIAPRAPCDDCTPRGYQEEHTRCPDCPRRGMAA